MKTVRSFLGNPNGKMCLIIIIALSVFVIMSSLYSVTNMDDANNSNGLLVHRPIPEAVNRSHIEGTGFVFLALGAQANQMNCPAAIESLARFSGWNGDVFLITDQEYCFNTQEIMHNSGLSSDKFHYIVTQENFNRGGFDFEHPHTIGFRMARVRSLNMKTKLFQLIKDPKIHTLAYVDCDILFTQPNCAQEFVSTGPNWQDFPIRFSHVFRDKQGVLEDIHAGSFVIHREHSKQALQMWHDQISLGTDEGDNDAYMRVYREYDASHASSANANANANANTNTKKGLLRRMLQASTPEATPDNTITGHDNNHKMSAMSNNNNNHHHGNSSHSSNDNHDKNTEHKSGKSVEGDSNNLVIDSIHKKNTHNPMEPGEISRGFSNRYDDQQNWFEKFLELENPREFCMQHIPKARCARYGRKHIQTYVDRFHLKSYQDGHMYCVSAFLRPLLYGWFPLGYLPFCPKMEQIL